MVFVVSPVPKVSVRSLPSVSRPFGSFVVTMMSTGVPTPCGDSVTVTLALWPSRIFFRLTLMEAVGRTSSSRTVNSRLAINCVSTASSRCVTGTS